jgi:peptidylprolyl isomerase domain and WD repeat-containing protein 1
MPTVEGDSEVVLSKGRKKKRAGKLCFVLVIELELKLIAVLPHERIFLDNMPDTDRYTKSFMHRSDVNFVTMTK